MDNFSNYASLSTNGFLGNASRWNLSAGFFLFCGTFDLLIATTTALANFVLLFTIYRDPNHCLRTPATYLIANLGFSDFLNGILVGYGRATEEIYEYFEIFEEFPSVIGGITYFSAALTLFVNLATILGISFDIFIATTKPLNYVASVTRKAVCRGICFSWVLGTFLSVLPAIYGLLGSHIVLLIYCYSHFVIPALFLPLLYLKIFLTLAVQRKNTEQLARGSRHFISQKFSLTRKRKTIYTILTVLGLLYASFLPYFIKVHIVYFCSSCFQLASVQAFHIISNQSLMFACLANPFLYGWRVPKFRQALKSIMHLSGNRIGRKNTVIPLHSNTAFIRDRT